MGFSVLSVFWYDTEEDDPKEVESLLIKKAKENGVLPLWNKKGYKIASNQRDYPNHD